MREKMNNHDHKCPLCKKIYNCSIQAKHDEPVICEDGYKSFCNDCQVNKWDEMITLLKKENRL